MDQLLRHRQTKGSATDRLNLNHRVTPRLHKLIPSSCFPYVFLDKKLNSMYYNSRVIPRIGFGTPTPPRLAFLLFGTALEFKSFVRNTYVILSPFAQLWCKFAHASYFESTLAKVYQNKALYLSLKSTLMQTPPGEGAALGGFEFSRHHSLGRVWA